MRFALHIVLVVFVFECFILNFAPVSNVHAADGPNTSSNERSLVVRSDSHWIEFRGKPVLLVGDSITQGWMELGESFDQKAYVDALARRGINLILLWSYIGITDQVKDPRIGYDAPEIWPWERVNG